MWLEEPALEEARITVDGKAYTVTVEAKTTMPSRHTKYRNELGEPLHRHS
jgi:hypothetical protein